MEEKGGVLNSKNFNIPLETQMTQSKPWLKIVLFAGTGIILISSLVFVGYQLGIKQSTFTTNPFPTPLTTPTLFPTSMAVTTPTPDPTADWKTYTNTRYGFLIKYPRDWITEDNTQVFSEGDLFSVKIIGKSQKTSTELYDGAGLTIGVPIETNKDLLTWVKEYYPIKNINDKPNVFTEEKIGLLHFQKVYTCGLGCFTYYNIKHNNNVYRIMIFAEGPNESNYLTILNLMLSTFKFFGFQISPTSLVE